MRKMSETEKAWLAGIIDGEGCICVSENREKRYSRGISFCLQVYVSMSHKPTVLKIKELTKIGSFHRTRDKRNPNSKIMWKWKIKTKQAWEFLENILKYLVTKRDNALNAIEFAKNQRVGGPRRTDEEFQKQLEHCKKSKALNDVRFE